MNFDFCEKDPNLILDISKTYLTTPYYKTIPEIDSSGPTFGPEYNYSNYDKFCLTTNLEPIFASLDLTFDINSVKISNKMVLCIIPRLKGSIFEMTQKTQYQLQEEVDFVCSNLYHLCLLFDVFSDDIYPRAWLIDIFSSLKVSASLNPSFINGKLYLSLNESTDYIEDYSDALDNLMVQISQLYNTGSIICDSVFAKNWNLTYYRDKIYIAEWIDTRITKDKTTFLFNVLSGVSITIDIPENLLYYHHISKVINSPLIDKGKLQFNPGSIQDLKKILEIISADLEKVYTITQIFLPSHQLYLKIKDKISRKWTNADVVTYKNPDPHRPIALSVLIQGQINNLRSEINKLL